MKHSLYANVRYETEMIWLRRRTKGFLLLPLLLPVCYAILLTLLPYDADAMRGLGSNIPMLMLRLFTFAIIPLFLFATAAAPFSGEEDAHTLKLVPGRPITRTKAFAAKVAAMAVYVAVCLMTLWISSVLSGWSVPGGDEGSLAESMRAYAASFVPMMAIGLIAVLLAQFSTTVP